MTESPAQTPTPSPAPLDAGLRAPDRRRLIVSVALSGLLPLILYTLIRPLVASDASALILAGMIPAARTVALWLWRRRVDWIGVLAILGFALAGAISFLTGGSALALELRGSVVEGLVGLVCLISVLIGMPLLTMLPQLLAHRDAALAARLKARMDNPASRKRLRWATAALGLLLVAKTAADLALALSLSTESFLAVSKVFNWGALAVIIGFLWWLRHRAGGLGVGGNG